MLALTAFGQYLVDVLDHDVLDLCDAAAHAIDGVGLLVAAVVFHALFQSLAEIAIVRIGRRALRCVSKSRQVPLPHVLQECKGDAPAKVLYKTPRSVALRDVATTRGTGCHAEMGVGANCLLFGWNLDGNKGARTHLICHAEEGDAISDNYVEKMPFLGV